MPEGRRFCADNRNADLGEGAVGLLLPVKS